MINLNRYMAFFGVSAMLLSAGCLEEGVKADKGKFDLIQPGVTSQTLVQKSFGAPDAVDTVGDKTVLIYSHLKASFGLLGIAGSLDYDRQSYQFVVNRSGLVESCVLREYHGSSGIFGGAGKESAVTPAATVLPGAPAQSSTTP